jgi:hypothetical protein
VLSYREMLTRTAAAMGKRRLVVPVPVLTPNLSAYWVDLVTDIPRSISHPLIEGLRNPVVVTDDSIRDHVSVELASFDEAVRRALRDSDAVDVVSDQSVPEAESGGAGSDPRRGGAE